MATNVGNEGRRFWSRWRAAGWATATALLLAPLLAMQLTDEVAWDLSDFAIAAGLICGVGIAYELAVRQTRNGAYRAAVAVALAAAFILIWANLAVGVIGSENNHANWMYAGVLAVGLGGALITRCRPRGMAGVLVVTALAQALVAVIASFAELGHVWPMTAFFVALWLTSAWLFRKSGAKAGLP